VRPPPRGSGFEREREQSLPRFQIQWLREREIEPPLQQNHAGKIRGSAEGRQADIPCHSSLRNEGRVLLKEESNPVNESF